MVRRRSPSSNGNWHPPTRSCNRLVAEEDSYDGSKRSSFLIFESAVTSRKNYKRPWKELHQASELRKVERQVRQQEEPLQQKGTMLKHERKWTGVQYMSGMSVSSAISAVASKGARGPAHKGTERSSMLLISAGRLCGNARRDSAAFPGMWSYQQDHHLV